MGASISRLGSSTGARQDEGVLCRGKTDWGPLSILPARGNIDIWLTDDILVAIFELLEARELVGVLPFVSRRWHSLSTGEQLWGRRFPSRPGLSERCLEFSKSDLSIPLTHAGAWLALYRTNLMANVSWHLLGQFRKVHPRPYRNTGFWYVRVMGNLWQVEDPPIGISTLSLESLPVIRMNHAVTVDLKKSLEARGLNPRQAETFLDSSPPMLFTVWYGGRLDCAGTAIISVTLSADYRKKTHPIGGHTWESGEISTVHNEWRQWRADVQEYPAGMRFAEVELKGKDAQFWQGFYGAKFAQPQLIFRDEML